jgi:hypothetical protein
MNGKQKTLTVAHGQPELLVVTCKGTANSSVENTFFLLKTVIFLTNVVRNVVSIVHLIPISYILKGSPHSTYCYVV